MAFVNTTNKFSVGDEVTTTKKHESMSGYFEVGSEVTIIGIGDRGYDNEDNEGNRILEIGWEI